jgi:transcriptional regulator with XRE-family HTH domain
MTLGQALRTARAQKKMSLRDVERATGNKISNGYLSLLESDEIKQPSPIHLYEVARVLGVSYPELMELAGYVAPTVKTNGQLAGLAFSGANHLTPGEREDVEKYIAFLRSKRPGVKRK